MTGKISARFLTHSAAVAALYIVLTLIAAALGLSSGVIQLRFSEALTVLPYFMPSAVPGLFIGCIGANLLTGSLPWDVVFGSLATLLGAIGTRALCKKNIYFASLPPILANTLIVPFILQYVYGAPDSFWFLVLTVGAGEILSCGVLGTLVAKTLEKHKFYSE